MKYFRLGVVFLLTLMIFMLSSCTDSHHASDHDKAEGTGIVDGLPTDNSVVTPKPGDNSTTTPGASNSTTSEPGNSEDPKTETPGAGDGSATGAPDTSNNPATWTPDTGEHVHVYTGATCTTAGKCECGATNAALGHTFTEATCTAPATCTHCGATNGKALGHSYAGLTCTTSGKCTRCGATSGALGHDFAAATCTAPSTCKRCQITSGSALGHNYSSGKCTRCGDTNGPLTPEEAKLFKNKLTDEENAQALAVARGIAKKIEEVLPNGSDLDRIGMAAELVSHEYYKGVHVEKGSYYNQAYGVFIKRESSCAGCCRALGLVLSCMGYQWTHINEHLWKHQWVTLTINGETIWADGQIGMVGIGDYPYYPYP